MKKLLCVFVSLVLVVFSVISTPISADSSQDLCISFKSPERMADYIQRHLQEFVHEYNLYVEGNSVDSTTLACNFEPEYCEKIFPVQLINSEEHVICIDFNEENGYMIVSNESIIKIATCGNLNYLYNSDYQIYYSLIDNDFVYNLDGDFHLFTSKDESIVTPDTYAGTQGNGVIFDKNAYIHDRYGETELDEFDYLLYQNVSKFTQIECSFYAKIENNIVYSEGNCMLVATLNFLNVMKNNGTYTSLPNVSSQALVLVSSDYFYQSALDNGYTVYHTSVPALYYRIREIAVSNYGYTVSNSQKPNGDTNPLAVNSNNAVAFIERIGTYYGLNLDIRKKSVTMQNVKNQIEDHKPVLWIMSNDSIYGDHAVVITGYSVYKQYTTILGIRVCTNTIKTLRLSNGWNGEVVHYDMENTNGHLFIFN